MCVCLYICEKKYSSGGVALPSVKPVFTIPKSQHVLVNTSVNMSKAKKSLNMCWLGCIV